MLTKSVHTVKTHSVIGEETFFALITRESVCTFDAVFVYINGTVLANTILIEETVNTALIRKHVPTNQESCHIEQCRHYENSH